MADYLHEDYDYDYLEEELMKGIVKNAVIVGEDEKAKYVFAPALEYPEILIKGSLNRTPHPIGTKGRLVYRASLTSGLWFFEADES